MDCLFAWNRLIYCFFLSSSPHLLDAQLYFSSMVFSWRSVYMCLYDFIDGLFWFSSVIVTGFCSQLLAAIIVLSPRFLGLSVFG